MHWASNTLLVRALPVVYKVACTNPAGKPYISTKALEGAARGTRWDPQPRQRARCAPPLPDRGRRSHSGPRRGRRLGALSLPGADACASRCRPPPWPCAPARPTAPPPAPGHRVRVGHHGELKAPSAAAARRAAAAAHRASRAARGEWAAALLLLLEPRRHAGRRKGARRVRGRGSVRALSAALLARQGRALALLLTSRRDDWAEARLARARLQLARMPAQLGGKRVQRRRRCLAPVPAAGPRCRLLRGAAAAVGAGPLWPSPASGLPRGALRSAAAAAGRLPLREAPDRGPLGLPLLRAPGRLAAAAGRGAARARRARRRRCGAGGRKTRRVHALRMPVAGPAHQLPGRRVAVGWQARRSERGPRAGAARRSLRRRRLRAAAAALRAWQAGARARLLRAGAGAGRARGGALVGALPVGRPGRAGRAGGAGRREAAELRAEQRRARQNVLHDRARVGRLRARRLGADMRQAPCAALARSQADRLLRPACILPECTGFAARRRVAYAFRSMARRLSLAQCYTTARPGRCAPREPRKPSASQHFGAGTRARTPTARRGASGRLRRTCPRRTASSMLYHNPVPCTLSL